MTSSPIPGIVAIGEIAEAMNLVPEEQRGLAFERTLSTFSPNEVSRRFELALAVEWARQNDAQRGKELLVSILCRQSDSSKKYPHGFKKVDQRDKVVAASVIQWLGTALGECFLRDAFREAGGSCVISHPSKE